MALYRPALAIFGAVLLILAALMLLPLPLLIIDEAPDWQAFLIGAGISGVTGATLLVFNKQSLSRLTSRSLFLITCINWFGVPVFAAIPFLLSDLGLSITDAVFESVSGVTTTGSTVLTGLDYLPKDLLLWRSITQWLGGIGFIGMAVAILPFLRIGGMRLFQTESSDWSDKAMPRAKKLLESLLITYLVLSVLFTVCYGISGMTWFEALNHAMTTVSTGGYSTSDASLGHFNSKLIHWETTVFMAMGSIPFVLYVRLAMEQKLSAMLDSQARAFIAVTSAVAFLLAIYLTATQQLEFWDAITASFLNVTSIITTTGYASTDYTSWGGFAVVVFFFATFIGGCSGSTSGGIKVFRFQLFFLILHDQLIKSIHPRAVTTLRYNERKLNEDVISSSIAFMFIAMTSFCILALILSACGLDFMTSLSGSLTALMNVGPGLGSVIGPAGNFQTLPDLAKWALCIGMIMGRLEYIAVAVLFSRVFWRG